MKKRIKITEDQLTNIIISEQIKDNNKYPAFTEHWESKFEKSAEILLKLGHHPDDLRNKIDKIFFKLHQG
jgi:hypothetical protein